MTKTVNRETSHVAPITLMMQIYPKNAKQVRVQSIFEIFGVFHFWDFSLLYTWYGPKRQKYENPCLILELICRQANYHINPYHRGSQRRSQKTCTTTASLKTYI